MCASPLMPRTDYCGDRIVAGWNLKRCATRCLPVAGRLDTQFVGGPPFALEAQPSSPRRSIYAYISREEPSALMRSFDFSNPEHAHSAAVSNYGSPAGVVFAEQSVCGDDTRHGQLAASLKGSGHSRAQHRTLPVDCLGVDPTVDRAEGGRAFQFATTPASPEIEPPPEGPWRYGTLALDIG